MAEAMQISPLQAYLGLHRSASQLRTAYTHLAKELDPSVDRTAAIEARSLCRSGAHTSQTSGMAPSFVQANMVACPKEFAFDFLSFALRNPKACPLLAVTDPGDPCPRNVAPTANLKTDIPKYRIWVDGVLKEEVSDASSYWGDDMVGFLLGCSFSWEVRSSPKIS